jgi:hypothetical protein
MFRAASNHIRRLQLYFRNRIRTCPAMFDKSAPWWVSDGPATVLHYFAKAWGRDSGEVSGSRPRSRARAG